MPKDRSHAYPSSARSRPYAHSSKHTDVCGSKNNLPSQGNEREWEEARCAICMEHPHNVVLLLCSSHEKGCRPFMCDTSHRHSNCLDQFRKSSPSIQQIDLMEDFPPSNNIRKLRNKLPCPLCRGQISGCMVLERARTFMNLKTRSCSLECCDFIGTYPELRAHARREHPYVCPTKVDPTRQEEWARLENETTYQDLLGLSGHRDLDWLPVDDYSEFFEQLEPGSDWEESMENDYSLFSENDVFLSLEIEHELPFTFIDSPLLHHDPNCPHRTRVGRSPQWSPHHTRVDRSPQWSPHHTSVDRSPQWSPHHTSVDRSPQWRYQLVNRELSRSTSDSDSTTRRYPSRRSNSGRGPGQQNRRL